MMRTRETSGPTRRRLLIATAGVVALAWAAWPEVDAQGGRSTGAPPPALPVMTLDTAKGAITIRLYATEAPKSVAHIAALINRNFYNGQRIHRVEKSLVQFGDPGSRDMSRRDSWGTGSSYNPIGVAEFTKRSHIRGTVALAHSGRATMADSQIYILKAAMPGLDGKHVVIGQVLTGMAVVDQFVVTDFIKKVTVTLVAAATPR
jgi:cyclophilin family peptidyl-prolyl cis-trans isomerase